jgi:phosphoserine phosphatase RsbU/P
LVATSILISLRCLGGARLQDEALLILRDRVADIIFGTLFLFGGLAACCIAAIRRGSSVRILIWLGVWSAMYGAQPLANSMAVLALLPQWFLVSLPFVSTANAYLILVVGSLAFLELSLGLLRVWLKAVISVGLAMGLAGIGFFIFTGSNEKLMLYNHLLAACSLFVLVTVVAVPRLSNQLLVLPSQSNHVLAVGTLVFALEALYVNLARPLGYKTPHILDTLGFAVLLFSFGYVALQTVFASERQLLSIENELATAREIQTSILPRGSPELKNLRITAAYRPMTAVAGDFYDFISLDENRVGILVADVSGHGVPAALIAAMIKVALQSAVLCAHDPREVLRGLNRILSGQSHDQFVTAAYLWFDSENRRALYSAAGHPPLIRSSGSTLERIESNGIVFGVMPDPDYPVCEIPISPGDRFLLYTDGVIEPENARFATGDRLPWPSRTTSQLSPLMSFSPAPLGLSPSRPERDDGLHAHPDKGDDLKLKNLPRKVRQRRCCRSRHKKIRNHSTPWLLGRKPEAAPALIAALRNP